MFLPRSRVLLAYGDELLTSPTDRKVGLAVAILTCAVVWGGYRYTESVHPYTVPIQAGESKVDAMPIARTSCNKVTHANMTYQAAHYVWPWKSQQWRLSGQHREFTTAGVRFVTNWDSTPGSRLSKRTGSNWFINDDDKGIQPGETVKLRWKPKMRCGKYNVWWHCWVTQKAALCLLMTWTKRQSLY